MNAYLLTKDAIRKISVRFFKDSGKKLRVQPVSDTVGKIVFDDSLKEQIDTVISSSGFFSQIH